MSIVQLTKIYRHNVDKQGFYPMTNREALDLIFWARLWIGATLGLLVGVLRITGYLPLLVAFVALDYPARLIARATNIPMRILNKHNLIGGFSALALAWILLFSMSYVPTITEVAEELDAVNATAGSS